MMVSIAVELCRGDALAWMVPEQIDDVAVVGKLPSGKTQPDVGAGRDADFPRVGLRPGHQFVVIHHRQIAIVVLHIHARPRRIVCCLPDYRQPPPKPESIRKKGANPGRTSTPQYQCEMTAIYESIHYRQTQYILLDSI